MGNYIACPNCKKTIVNILAIINFRKENLPVPLSAVIYAIYNLIHKMIAISVLSEEDREKAGIYLGYEKGES